MSTHSTIRMVLPSGERSKIIYCHWDGYPSAMLPLLNENYNTIEKVEELISLGNLSSLNEKIKPDNGENHSFDNPAPDVTVAYHRDRGEKLEWAGEWAGCYQKEEFNYLFNGKKWKMI